MRKILAVVCALLLAGCSTILTKARGHFNQAMAIKSVNKPRAMQYFAEAKDLLFNAVQLEGLQDNEKVGPLSLIVRIYIEEKDPARAQRYINKASEYVDPAGSYNGDEISLRLIKGTYFERLASQTIYNVDADKEHQSAVLWDKAVKYLEKGLIQYYTANEKRQEPYIERFIDLHKIRAFMSKAKIYEQWKVGGRREFLAKALANYTSAMTIAKRNAGKAFAFEKEFDGYKNRLEGIIELLTTELEK